MSIYTDERDTTGIEVVDNDLSANAFSGLILKGDGKQTDEPLITGNNFANCGGYAIAADAKNATFSRKQKNYFKGVRSALYLANGNFVVKGLDLSGSGATAPQIFVESAKSLTVSKVNLSYSAPATSSQERVALHLYRVGEVSISGLVVNGADVGLKVATEQGTNTSLKMAGSSINHSVMAAVMLQSYDDTALGLVRIQGNDFSNNPAGYAVWQVGTTALGAGSFVGGNTQ